MIIFIIIFNLLITLINIYLVLKIWKLRQLLMYVTDALQKSEVNARILFKLAPKLLLKQQQKLVYCRKTYQKLRIQIEQLRKIFTIVIWLIKIWQRQTKLIPASSLKLR
jgi:cell division protein FtsB